VWNSKRILLLGLGFFLFLAGYLVYAYFLGGIDGLPPLPRTLERSPNKELEPPHRTIKHEVVRKLEEAFGDKSPEVGRAIKLEIRKKGLVLAAEATKILENGQVQLTPFSMAIFSEDRGDGKPPEINTVKSKVALLTFDQPIVTMTDIGSRKIVGAELKGDIILTNNRRTAQKMDDIEVRVDHEPLFYDDKLNKVWTAGHVQLLDMQTRPDPTKILGKGLEMFLTREEPAAKAAGAKAKPKPKGDAIGGVDEVVLLANVEMHLYPEETNSGFPSGGNDTRKPAAGARAGKKDKKQERSHVVIRTPGQFHYDVPKDIATFEIPKTGAQEQVMVTREIIRNKAEKRVKGEDFDQLLCSRLVLQFRRKAPAAPGEPREGRATGTDREIESACATALPGTEVVLTMDTEKLDAGCEELTYRCPTAARGAQTVLKGKARPMWAIKEGHKIQARQLTLVSADQKGNGQQVEADGPGQVDLFDPNNPNRKYPNHAFWQDKLVSAKARDGDRVLDLLTFTDDAFFLDEEHDQELHGQKLQLWLEPNDGSAEQAKAPEGAASNPGQRLQKVEAFERVRARAPEMNILDCEHLLIYFRNAVATLPDNVAAAGTPTHTAEKPAPTTTAATPPTGPTANGLFHPAPPAPPAPAAKPAEPEKKPKKPINLWGRDIVAYVTRVGPKNELREMAAEGTVHVHQDGAEPQDKGVDIKGDRLRLTRQPAGDVLDVFADGQEPAQLQLGDLHLEGPKVRVDQEQNLAWVVGPGGMVMASKTTFDGGKPAKADSKLTVRWTRNMLFNGKDAEFYGAINADQDNGALKSDSLYVTLDKTVSFKEGQKGGQGAKAERVLAHGSVYVMDSKFDEKTGELLEYQRLRAYEVATHNLDGRLIATGPGVVYGLQKGSADPLEQKPAQGGARPAPKGGSDKAREEMFLTRVEFENQMNSNETQIGADEKKKRRTSKFYGNVKVHRLAAKDPDAQLDLNRMPPGSTYMESAILTVITEPLPDGKKTQKMDAQGRVFFRTPEFYCRADKVYYDESKDTVIFASLPGNKATLYRRKAGIPGHEYDEVRGETIVYNRRTGEFTMSKGDLINVR
jgi:hypothetical protein